MEDSLDLINQNSTEISKRNHDNLKNMISCENSDFPLIYYVKNLGISGFPITISYFCHYLTEFICLCMLAKSSSEVVGPVALGMMICNTAPFSFLYGFADGIGTLISQAHGAQENKLCGEYLNKGIVITELIIIPWIFLMCFLNYILEYLGYLKEDSIQIGIYLKMTFPYLLFFGITETFRRFLTSIQIFKIESFVYSISLLASIGYSFLFVIYLDWKTYGAAYAMNLLGLTECCLFFLYCYFSKSTSSFMTRFSEKVWKDWSTILRLSIPNSIISIVRSSTQGFVDMSAGIFSSLQLKIQSCCFMILLVLSCPVFSFAYAMYSYVGNSIGARNVRQALKWFEVAISFGNLIALVEIILCYIFEESFVNLFFKEKQLETKQYMKNLNWFIVTFFLLKCNVHFLKLLIVGIGRQRSIVYGSIVISFVMVVFTCILSFSFGIGLEIYGLWIGICFNFICCLIYYIIKLPKDNWEILVEESMGRITHDKEE